MEEKTWSTFDRTGLEGSTIPGMGVGSCRLHFAGEQRLPASIDALNDWCGEGAADI